MGSDAISLSMDTIRELFYSVNHEVTMAQRTARQNKKSGRNSQQSSDFPKTTFDIGKMACCEKLILRTVAFIIPPAGTSGSHTIDARNAPLSTRPSSRRTLMFASGLNFLFGY